MVFSWILYTFLLNIWPKNQKNLEFFCFLPYFNLGFLQKNQKNPRFFLVFKNLNQKKTKKLKENQKKTSFDLKPKLLQKVLVFWFFGFLEVSFGFKNLNQKKQKNSRKTKKNNLLTWNQNFSKKFCFFCFLVFSRFRHIVFSCSAAIADQELNRFFMGIFTKLLLWDTIFAT